MIGRALLLLLLLPIPGSAAPLLPLPKPTGKPAPAKPATKPPVKPAPEPDETETETEEEDEEEEEAEEESRLYLGISGSRGREANVDDFNWGPTLSLELVSSDEDARTRLRYGVEASYNDASTRFAGSEGPQTTRVKTFDFRYAKVSLLKLWGFDLRERVGLVPYIAGGVQHIHTRTQETVEDDNERRTQSVTLDNYWSPSWGVGTEIRLNSRLNMVLDYSFNAQHYERRVNRLSLEMKVRVFGAEE